MALYAYPSCSTAPLFPSSLPSPFCHRAAAHLSLSLFLLHLLPRLPFSLAQATTPPLSLSRGLFEHPPRPSSSTTGWFPTSTPLDSSPCLSLSLLLVIFQFPSLAPASFVLLLRHGGTFECQPPGRHRSVAFFSLFFVFPARFDMS